MTDTSKTFNSSLGDPVPVQFDLLGTKSPSEPTAPVTAKARHSAFDALGFRETIAQLQEEVRALYTADQVPWIVGYSGGKDSTATLQLIWSALADLPSGSRRKTVHVISTDTLVENPIVSAWVGNSIRIMRAAAREQGMPFEARLLQPRLDDRFWVNLIGRGYPAPRHMFRWCTERLKIAPSNDFIHKVVSARGETILALGTRKTISGASCRLSGRSTRCPAGSTMTSAAPGCWRGGLGCGMCTPAASAWAAWTPASATRR